MYEFQQSRSKKAMIEFATSKGKGSEPVSFFAGPFGPFGQIRALTMNTVTWILDLYEYLVEHYFSPTFAAVLMAGVFVFLGTIFVIVAGLLLVPKPKVD